MRAVVSKRRGERVWLISSRPINNIAQTFAHPQSIARGVVEEVEVRFSLLFLLLFDTPKPVMSTS